MNVAILSYEETVVMEAIALEDDDVSPSPSPLRDNAVFELILLRIT